MSEQRTFPMDAHAACAAMGIATTTLYKRAARGQIEHDGGFPRKFFIPEQMILGYAAPPSHWFRGTPGEIGAMCGRTANTVRHWAASGKLVFVGCNDQGRKLYAIDPEFVTEATGTVVDTAPELMSIEEHRAYKAVAEQRHQSAMSEIESLRNRIAIEAAKHVPLKAQLAATRTELDKAKETIRRDGLTLMNAFKLLAAADGLCHDGDYLEDAIKRTIARLEKILLENDKLQDDLERHRRASEYLHTKIAYKDAESGLAAARRAIMMLAEREAM